MPEVQPTTITLVDRHLENLSPGKRTIYTGLVPVLDSVLNCSQYLMMDRNGLRSYDPETGTQITAEPFFQLILEDLEITHGLTISPDSSQFASFKNQVYTFYSDCLVDKSFETEPEPVKYDDHKRNICALYCKRFTKLTDAVELLRGFEFDESLLNQVEQSIGAGNLNNEFRFNDLWKLLDNLAIDNGKIKMACSSGYHWRLIEGIHMSETALLKCFGCTRGLNNGKSLQSINDYNGCLPFASRMKPDARGKRLPSRQPQAEPIELKEQPLKPTTFKSSLAIFTTAFADFALANQRGDVLKPITESVLAAHKDYRANWIINLCISIKRYASSKESSPELSAPEFINNLFPCSSIKHRRLMSYILSTTDGMEMSRALPLAERIWDRNMQTTSNQTTWGQSRDGALLEPFVQGANNPFFEVSPQEAEQQNILIEPVIMFNLIVYSNGVEFPILFPIKIDRLTYNDKGEVKIFSCSSRKTGTNDILSRFQELLIGNAAVAAIATLKKNRAAIENGSIYVRVPFHELTTQGFETYRQFLDGVALEYTKSGEFDPNDIQALGEYLEQYPTDPIRTKETERNLAAYSKMKKRFSPKPNPHLQRRDGDNTLILHQEYVQDRLF